MGRHRAGRLLAGGGFAWFAGDLLPALLYLHRGPVFHALLAYPDGRIRGRLATAVVVAAYVDVIVDVQDRPGHGRIVPRGRLARSGLALWISRASRDPGALRRP